MKSSLSYRPGRCENEASRRLYRGATEIAQRLEINLNQVTSFTDLFSNPIGELRIRLKEYCDRLIFTDPVVYGKKAEDLLWRKVYYEFFQKCKQNKKKLLESEYHTLTVRSQLLAAMGSYHHMLLRIQTEFHLDLEGKLDAPFLWHLKGMKKERWKKYQRTSAADGDIQAWANQAVHRTLIYLGDLARYIAELNDPDFAHMAERYYLQAFCLNYKNGMPHNQLGSLANNKFDSAYHYMRCLASIDKFDGAEGNLKRAFERNNQTMQEFNSANDVSARSVSLSRFLRRFLKLCEIFYFSADENIQSICHEILQDFESWMQNPEMSSEPEVLSDDSSYSVSSKDEIVFKVCVMSLMCGTRLEERGSSDVAVATAFTLALFSILVRCTLKHLFPLVYESVPNGTIEPCPSPSTEINGLRELTISESEENNGIPDITAHKGIVSMKKKLRKMTPSRLRKLRRRRKISSTSQEDSECSDAEEPPESDDENVLNSDGSQVGSCSSESGSDHEEDDSFLVEQNNLENDSKSEITNTSDSVVIDHLENSKNFVCEDKTLKDKDLKVLPEGLRNGFIEKINQPPDSLFKTLRKIGLLQSLKVLMDWLRTQAEVMAVCSEASQTLLSNILELLNINAQVETHLLQSREKLTHLIRLGEGWQQSIPLPEDILLMHLPALKNIHLHLKFDVNKRKELAPNEQVFLRTQCFLAFGDVLSSATGSEIVYDRRKNRFLLKHISDAKKDSNHSITNGKVETKQESGSQKQHVMHEMAHLWLKAEVNNLEAIVESKSHPQLSPLLVTDTSALCRHLPLLKQLVAAKKFIVIVPKIVIDSLDQIKKKSLGAREAIRWLEYVFQKGSRHIRAQRDVEKTSLHPMKYPKKKEKDSWDFFQILECCYYLVQQQSSGKLACSLVTLVVGTHNQLPSNAAAVAKSLSVNMENLENFFAKWRSSSKNPG